MKHTKRTSCLSILLVFAMVATCFVAFSVTSSAELATELPTSWGAELPEGVLAWGDEGMKGASTSLSGSGTEADPYLIANVKDFMYFVTTMAKDEATTGNNFAGKSFKMTGDVYFPVITAEKIALSAIDSQTDARYFVPPAFAGHFNGAGHTIWNPMNGYRGVNSCSSIFGTLTGATVENLTVKGAFFSNSYSYNGSSTVAGLADKITGGGTVKNCHVVDAYLSGDGMGGLIRCAEGSAAILIEGCTVSGTFAPTGVFNSSAFGGIVAYVNAGKDGTLTIKKCENRMSCPLDNQFIDVGGIVGNIKAAKGGLTIENCTNYGSYINYTKADYTDRGIGGIIGRSIGGLSPTITNCENKGDFTAPNNCGGVYGLIFTTTSGGANISMTGTANFGSITATGQNAGGLIGCVARWTGYDIIAQDCANYGSVQATEGAGGYVGSVLMQNLAIKSSLFYCTNFSNYGDIKATNKFAGLIIGFYSRGTTSPASRPNIAVTNAVLTGSVSATACAGSICGGYTTTNSNHMKMFITLTGCYVDCSMTATERSGAVCGGFVAATDTEQAGSYLDTTDLTLNMTDAKFHVTLNGKIPAYNYFVTTTTTADDGVTTTTTTGKSASLPALDTAELTNDTALAALNKYATDNTLGKWVQGTKAPELEIFYQAPSGVQVNLDGATLALGDTMTLKLFVKASSAAKIDGLKSIMVNDGTKDYAGKLDATAENYVFEIAGLAAKDMGAAKTYTVKYTLTSDTANPITCDRGVEYSPLQYVINMYKKNIQDDTVVDANFAALLVAMARYIDAAEVKTNGSLTLTAKETFATATGYAFGDTSAAYEAIVNKDKDSTYTLTSGTAELAAELTSGIILRVKPASGMTLTSVKIGDTALTITSVEGEWRVTGINPGNLYNELTFTFTNSSEETVTATYSIARYLNSYVVSDKTETAVKDLAKATALYMDAFITYKTATN